MLQFGEHSQKKNMAVVRRVNAKTFAQAGTAAEALKLMEANKVPLEERPPAWQIKNFRPSKGRVQEREVADTDAVDRKADMSSALLLGLASTEEHVRHALASPGKYRIS